MNRIFRANIIDFTGLFIIALALLLVSFSSNLKVSFDFPPSLLNLNTIFLSILIEGPTTFCINRRAHRRSHPNLCDRRTYPKMAS